MRNHSLQAWLWCAAWLAWSGPGRGAEPFVRSAEDLQRIEQAAPHQAIVPPLKPRRLLIFTLNVGYPGHPSIAYANEAFTLMGRRTGAFEAVVSAEPAVFERPSLKRFDAVFFNNTVGNCFTNADLRENLLEFVTGGGGLLGVHGTTVAFTRWPGAIEDWPEFGCLIGARGANHKDSNEQVWLKLDDPDHPLNQVFGGQGFEYRDEFFRPQGTYSRNRVRVLFSIDTAKTDPNTGQPRGNCFRQDNDYAMAWVRNYGRGRVFYCTIAHNPYVFWDPRMLQFYLAALQFALGDLAAPTTPSAKLTPAVRAQEKLGWRLGVDGRAFQKLTLFEAIDRTARLGLPYLGGLSSQQVSRQIPKTFGPQLTDAELSQVRLRLDSAGLRLLTYEIRELPPDETACRRLFDFGRKMGIEAFIAAPKPEALDLLERLCNEYAMKLALHDDDPGAPPLYGRPEGVLKLCQGRSKLIGACGDVEAWLGLGGDPVQAVLALKDRLITVQMGGWPGSSATERDPAWGAAPGPSRLLEEIRRLRLKPDMFGLACSDESANAMAVLARSIDSFNTASMTEAAKP